MEIFPHEVIFSPPFDQLRPCYLMLTNTTSETIIYKVKTTSPHLYCVRPNASAIEPGQQMEVEITRQIQPYSDSEVKSKFLIMSTAYSPRPTDESLTEVWTQMESPQSNVRIDSQKLKVTFQRKSQYDTPRTAYFQQTYSPSMDTSAGKSGHQSAGSGHSIPSPIPVFGRSAVTGQTDQRSQSQQHGLQAQHSHQEPPVQSERSPDLGNNASHAHSSANSPSRGASSREGEHYAHTDREASKEGHQNASAAGYPTGSGPNGEITVDDLQGSYGIPKKSKLIDEGDAKTGPRLSDSHSDVSQKPDGKGPSGSEKKDASIPLSPASERKESPHYKATNFQSKGGESGHQQGYLSSAKASADQALSSASGTIANASTAAGNAASSYANKVSSEVSDWFGKSSDLGNTSRGDTSQGDTTEYHSPQRSNFPTSPSQKSSKSSKSYAGGFENIVSGGYDSAPVSASPNYHNSDHSFTANNNIASSRPDQGSRTESTSHYTDNSPSAGTTVSGVGVGPRGTGSALGSQSVNARNAALLNRQEERPGSQTEGSSSKISNLKDQVENKLGNVKSTVSEKFGQLKDKVEKQVDKADGSSGKLASGEFGGVLGGVGVSATGVNSGGNSDYASFSGNTHSDGPNNNLIDENPRDKRNILDSSNPRELSSSSNRNNNHHGEANTLEERLTQSESKDGFPKHKNDSDISSALSTSSINQPHLRSSGEKQSPNVALSEFAKTENNNSSSSNVRGVSKSSDTFESLSNSATSSQQEVPLNVTVVLVVIAFLIGWKFF